MFNDNELMIMNREFLDFAYVLHDQIQIFRGRRFLQNESRSKKMFINSNIWKKWLKSPKFEFSPYNKYEENSLYDDVQDQSYLFTIKKFYCKYLSQIALAFEMKTIKKTMFNADQRRITQTQMQKYFANASSLILSIVNQQTITLFSRKTRTVKLIKTSIIISSAV